MKNKLIAILLLVTMVFTVTGCSSDSVVENGYVDDASLDSTFTRYPIGDGYSIIVKKDNNVCYLEYERGTGNYKIYGITVMLNPDGTPEIWDGNY